MPALRLDGLDNQGGDGATAQPACPGRTGQGKKLMRGNHLREAGARRRHHVRKVSRKTGLCRAHFTP